MARKAFLRGNYYLDQWDTEYEELRGIYIKTPSKSYCDMRWNYSVTGYPTRTAMHVKAAIEGNR